jgi:hypothetical protein
MVVTDNQVTSNAVKSDDSYSLYRCVPSTVQTHQYLNTCQKPVYRYVVGPSGSISCKYGSASESLFSKVYNGMK